MYIIHTPNIRICNRIQIGDQILSVDGVDVAGLREDVKELLTNNNPQVCVCVCVRDSRERERERRRRR
jgi:hypothetical protein